MNPQEGAGRAASPTSLTVLVPVYNEQYLVATSLARLRILEECPIVDSVQIIVIDDGSSDHSPEALRQFEETLESDPWGAKFQWLFLAHKKNQGKAAAIRTGIEHATSELTVIHDADLEYHPRDFHKMIPLFLEENAEAVFGSRFLSSDYRRVLLFRHALGNRLLTFLCNCFCDLNLSDMETCYKMVRTSLLRSIPLESKKFGIEVELTMKLAKRGARIFEVPINYSGRTYQEGKKISWKDGVRALGSILKYAASDNIYNADQYGSEILSRLNRAPKFTRWMAESVQPYVGEKVFEIGAGIGNLTVNLAPRKIYWASDINPLYLEYLRKLRESRPYLQVCYTDGTDAGSFPADQRFDTVICLNVVEHLEDDLRALRNIHAILDDNGQAVILVPNGPSLYGSLDKVLGHYRRYTREQLAELGANAGFKVETIEAFNRIGVAAWWLNGRVLRRQTFGLGQIKMLEWFTPLFRRIDSWIPLPPLSWIAVFRKEAPQEAHTKSAVAS